MPKIKYTGAHDSYTIAEITFKKGESIELSDDQIAKVKANGIGSRLFANGDLVADKAKTVTTDKADDKPAKSDAKTTK